MLRELSVQNLAVIQDVNVELAPGFCAWTGETGAGKTLLLEALGLLLGLRGSSDLIREGADELRVTGCFEPGPLRAEVGQLLGAESIDDEIVVTRRLSRAGRSTASINEQPVALATLRALGSMMVDIHSQHESQALLQPAYQLRLLDAFGGLSEGRDRWTSLAAEWRSLRDRLLALDADRQQRQRELALLDFEREELDRAAIQPGELAELMRERERLAHAQALQEFAQNGCARLYDDDGSHAEQLGKLCREAENWAEVDPHLQEVRRRLEGLRAETQDLAETLRSLAPRWEADPARRHEVEERVQLLRRLETKYGKSADELIPYRAALDEQAAELRRRETDQSDLKASLASVFDKLRELGGDLSKRRRKIAKQFGVAVQKELRELGMPDAALEARLEPLELGEDPLNAEVPVSGLDQLDLLLAANKGEPARPLRKVASGGELSRALLALKTVLAKHDHRVTLVFDEIDANVGGRLGDVLGEKLAALGKTHQIVCITHLPQVASYARHQWSIRKVRKADRTSTTIELLEGDARIEELASMLRGKSKNENTRKEAAAMLATAKKGW